jgi:hypothetical protein
MQHLAAVKLCLLLVASVCLAQNQTHPPAQTVPPPAATTPMANPADVASPDAIIAALYNVVSGPAGQKRDWDRMRSLFYQGARLIPTAPKQEGGMGATTLTLQEFIDRASPNLEKNGFSEHEIARHTDKWGNILQAFSTYESRHDPKDPTPSARGINSFQLFSDGIRWWILTIYWQKETPDNHVPPEFLPHSNTALGIPQMRDGDDESRAAQRRAAAERSDY